MKKTTLSLSVFAFVGLMVNAQVGIGTTDPNINSVLEISSPDKGLLMPRVALTSIDSPAPLTAHVAGMTVYNSATAGLSPNQVIPGFYVNDGTKWNRTYSSDGSVDAKWVNKLSGSVELLNLSDGSTIRPTGTEFVVLDNGNVGIGTAAASDKLTVNIGTDTGKGITITGADNSVKAINFAEIAGGQGEINWRKTGIDAAVAASIRSIGSDGYSNRAIGFFTGNVEDYETDAVERMRITPNGRIGIGTENPDSRLHIAYDPDLDGLNVEGISMNVGPSNEGFISFGNSLTISNQAAAQPLNLLADGGQVNINAGNSTNGGVKFKTGSVNRLVINTLSGSVGYDGVSIYGNSPAATAKFTREGRVGIGTDTPTEKLEVNGAIKVTNGEYGIIANGATSPTPTGGAGTVLFSNGHFFGWNGSQWKQLDN